tara:strand:+ start:80 stop:628 length:549 start_codon:yes stop_codon:yes gene_type:complete
MSDWPANDSVTFDKDDAINFITELFIFPEDTDFKLIDVDLTDARQDSVSFKSNVDITKLTVSQEAVKKYRMYVDTTNPEYSLVAYELGRHDGLLHVTVNDVNIEDCFLKKAKKNGKKINGKNNGYIKFVGNNLLSVYGKGTFNIKDTIKKNGGKWNAINKEWVFKKDKLEILLDMGCIVKPL